MTTGVDLGVGGNAGNANGNPPVTGADGGANGSALPVASVTGIADPWSGLNAAHKTMAEAKGWKGTNDLPSILDSYSALEKKLGERSNTPTAPKTAAEYEFKKPDNLPKEVGYNDAFANGFRDWAHKAGLSKEQASALHDNFVGYAMRAHQTVSTSQVEILNQRLAKAEKGLTTAWGAQDSPVFKQNMEFSRRAIEQLGIGNDLKEAGIILDVGGSSKVANDNVLKALAKVGQKLFAEDSVYGSSASGINPFEGKNFDVTAQGRLVQNDPAKALLMIQSLPAADRGQFAYLEGQLNRPRR